MRRHEPSFACVRPQTYRAVPEEQEANDTFHRLAPERRTPRRTVAGGLTARLVTPHLHHIAWSVDHPPLSRCNARYVV